MNKPVEFSINDFAGALYVSTIIFLVVGWMTNDIVIYFMCFVYICLLHGIMPIVTIDNIKMLWSMVK